MLFKFKRRLHLSNGNYHGYVKNGVPHGEGKIVYTDGGSAISFEGKFEYGKCVSGKLIYADGGTYVGTYKDGKKYQGVETFSSGSVFEGTYTRPDSLKNKIDGKYLWEGHGKIRYTDGTIFEGYIYAYEYRGTFTFQSGRVESGIFTEYLVNKDNNTVLGTLSTVLINYPQYEETIKNGNYETRCYLSGKSTIKYKNGDFFEGICVEGSPLGPGKYTFVNGAVYVGHFVDGLFQGYGHFTSADGTICQGNYFKGKLNGRALVKFENCLFECDCLFKDHAYSDGYIKMIVNDGTKIQGIYLAKSEAFPYSRIILDNGDIYRFKVKKGDLVEFEQISISVDEKDLIKTKIITETSRYEGQTYQGLPHGYGKMYFENGEYYEGKWYQGQMHHYGKYVFSDGRVYRGSFAENRIVGRGTYYLYDRAYYEGDVVDGLANGSGKWWSNKHDKVCYEGHFLGDKKCGFGHFYRWNSYYPFMGNYQNDLENGYIYVPKYKRSELFGNKGQESFIFKEGKIVYRLDNYGNDSFKSLEPYFGGALFKPSHHNEQ